MIFKFPRGAPVDVPGPAAEAATNVISTTNIQTDASCSTTAAAEQAIKQTTSSVACPSARVCAYKGKGPFTSSE